VDKSPGKKSRSSANDITQKRSESEPALQFMDNRSETIAQQKLQRMANNSPQSARAIQFQVMGNNNLTIEEGSFPFNSTINSRNELIQDTTSPIINPIQGVWQDSKMGVLKWDKLRDGVRWYFIVETRESYFLIEGKPPKAHANFYKQNEGFLKKKPRAQWFSENDFDETEKFAPEDLAVAVISLGKPRLWKNSGVIFKSQNVDKDTQKPKGKDSTYVVGDEGMLRYKEDKNQYLPHPDRHICYVNGGDFKNTRKKAFDFRAGAKEKISMQKDNGVSVTVLIGNDETPMTVSLVPVLGYRVVDFDYDEKNQKGVNFHVGHPVK